jgi:hypothetical protein
LRGSILLEHSPKENYHRWSERHKLPKIRRYEKSKKRKETQKKEKKKRKKKRKKEKGKKRKNKKKW